MNLFRCGTKDGSLDRKYLRVASAYRLLSRGTIDKARALELLAQRHTESEMRTLKSTVELWLAGPMGKDEKRNVVRPAIPESPNTRRSAPSHVGLMREEPQCE